MRKTTMDQHEKNLLMIVLIGAAVAVGKTLAAAERVTWAVFVGRAIVGGTTALAAGMAMAIWTDLPPAAIYGLASMCAHVGAEGLQALAGNYLSRKRQEE